MFKAAYLVSFLIFFALSLADNREERLNDVLKNNTNTRLKNQGNNRNQSESALKNEAKRMLKQCGVVTDESTSGSRSGWNGNRNGYTGHDDEDDQNSYSNGWRRDGNNYQNYATGKRSSTFNYQQENFQPPIMNGESNGYENRNPDCNNNNNNNAFPSNNRHNFGYNGQPNYGNRYPDAGGYSHRSTRDCDVPNGGYGAHNRMRRSTYYNMRAANGQNNNNYNNQCVSQCVFGYLQLLDNERSPSETMLIKWLQEHVTGNDMDRIEALRVARRCFGRLTTSDILDGCEFAKELSRCMELDLE